MSDAKDVGYSDFMKLYITDSLSTIPELSNESDSSCTDTITPIQEMKTEYGNLSYLKNSLFYFVVFQCVYTIYGLCEHGIVSIKENRLLGVAPVYFKEMGMLHWGQQEWTELMYAFFINPFVSEGLLDCSLYLVVIAWGCVLLSKQCFFTQLHFILLFLLTQLSMNSISFFLFPSLVGGLRPFALATWINVAFTLGMKCIHSHNSSTLPFLSFLVVSVLVVLPLTFLSFVHSWTADGVCIVASILNVCCCFPWSKYTKVPSCSFVSMILNGILLCIVFVQY